MNLYTSHLFKNSIYLKTVSRQPIFLPKYFIRGRVPPPPSQPPQKYFWPQYIISRNIDKIMKIKILKKLTNFN